jgi:hypothetical protein
MWKWARWVAMATLLLAAAAGAQGRFDLAAGGGGVASGGIDTGGGFWPAVSATLMFNRRFGINADFLPRAHGPTLAYQPWIADGNLAYRPLRGSWEPEVDIGVGFGHMFASYIILLPGGPGAQTGVGTAVGPHLGLAAIVHLSPHVFIRPTIDLYLFYPLGHPRYSSFAGIMVGYSFGGR